VVAGESRRRGTFVDGVGSVPSTRRTAGEGSPGCAGDRSRSDGKPSMSSSGSAESSG